MHFRGMLESLTPTFTENSFAHLDAFADRGWMCIDNFLDKKTCSNLLESFQEDLEKNRFSVAMVGKDLDQKVLESVRDSEIAWIEDWNRSADLVNLKLTFDQYIKFFNENFFLSLKRFESQFAIYQPGGFYKKHLDQLRGGNHRQITLIIYLNDCLDGGELVIYNKANKNKVDQVISPECGKMVIFFSSQIYHEVRPTQQLRLSLTSWFRDDLMAF